MLLPTMNDPEFDAVEKLIILSEFLSAELADIGGVTEGAGVLNDDEVRAVNELLREAEEIIGGTRHATADEINKLVDKLTPYATKLGLAL